MQLRIYSGMKPSIESVEECKKALVEKLGYAEVDIEEGRVVKPGIVNKELVEKILASKGVSSETDESFERSVETFYVYNQWLVFNFLDKKEVEHTNIFGALYRINLYPNKESETIENVIATTVAIDARRGVLCILTHTGKSAEKDFVETIEKMADALETRFIWEIVELEDDDLIRLSKICLDEGNKVTASSINTAGGRATFEHPEDIFGDSDIQQVDNIMKIKKRIDTGDWNHLIFRIINPGYYLKISRSKKMRKSMTLYPITKINVMDKSTASVILEDLVKRLSKIKKLRTAQYRL